MATAKETVLVTINTGIRPQASYDSTAELDRLGITGVQLIDKYRIKTDSDYVQVGQLAVTSGNAIKQIQDGYKDEKAKAHKAHADICANEKTDLSIWTKIRDMAARELKRWNEELERKKRAEEDRRRREDEERERKAREEAEALERKAQEEAAALRKQGEIRAARETVVQAQLQAQEIVAEAQESVGVVLPDNRPKVNGLGDSYRWKAREVVKEGDPDWGIMEVIRAIAAGRIPLRYLTPVRGGQPEMRRLLEINPTVLNEVGNRIRREDIGIVGTEGFKDWGMRLSGRASSAPSAPMEDTDW